MTRAGRVIAEWWRATYDIWTVALIIVGIGAISWVIFHA